MRAQHATAALCRATGRSVDIKTGSAPDKSSHWAYIVASEEPTDGQGPDFDGHGEGETEYDAVCAAVRDAAQNAGVHLDLPEPKEYRVRVYAEVTVTAMSEREAYFIGRANRPTDEEAWHTEILSVSTD